MARIVNYSCGQTLSGKDAEYLFGLTRQPVKEHHPDSQRSKDEAKDA